LTYNDFLQTLLAYQCYHITVGLCVIPHLTPQLGDTRDGVLIIRLYRSTTYVHAAYYYRPSGVVCLSVSLSVTLVSPVKTAQPIEMPFGLTTLVGPGNHVLVGGPDPPMRRGNFGGMRRRIVKYRDTLRSSVKKRLNRSRCRLGCGLRRLVMEGV